MKPFYSYPWLLLIGFMMIGFSMGSSTHAQESETEEDAVPVESEPVIELDREVHFLTPQGEDTVVSSGLYSVEAVEGALRLTPSDEGEDKAVIIQADATTHKTSIASSQPISIPGEEDQHVVLLLLPDGKAMQAVGTYSGVISRDSSSKRRPRIILSDQGRASLPHITSIHTSPLHRGGAPHGHLSPLGRLSLQGKKFGTSQGKLILRLKAGTYFRAPTTPTHNGSRPGTRLIEMKVVSWSDRIIYATIPQIEGVLDQQAILQIRSAANGSSIPRKVPFSAFRARTRLKFGEAVAKIACSSSSDKYGCLNDEGIDVTELRCFSGPIAKIREDKTISAYHVNCDDIGSDHGADMYIVQLKNRWVIKTMVWNKKTSSSSERVDLPVMWKSGWKPHNEALTKKYKGKALATIRVPWKVSPGAGDALSYWIDIDVEGPIGFPYK